MAPLPFRRFISELDNADPVLPLTSSSITTMSSTTITNLVNSTSTEDLWENLPITFESLMDNMTTVAPVNETTTTLFGSDVNDDSMVISAPGWAVTINSFLEVNLGVSLFFLMLIMLCSLFLLLICMSVWNCKLKYKIKNKISDVRINFQGYDRIVNNDGEVNANETLDTRVDNSAFAADGTLRTPPPSPQTGVKPKTSSVPPDNMALSLNVPADSQTETRPKTDLPVPAPTPAQLRVPPSLNANFQDEARESPIAASNSEYQI